MTKQSSANELSMAKGQSQADALFTQGCILRFGHSIVSATDKQSLLTVTEDICAVINAEYLAVYIRDPSKDDFKLRFASQPPSQPQAAEPPLPTISPQRKLWQFLKDLPDKELTKVPGQFQLGNNVYGITRRSNQNINTVLLLSFKQNTAPGFNLIFLKWLFTALEKALLRVRHKQKLQVQNAALKYLTEHTEESFARWQPNTGWQYFNRHLIYRLGYLEKDYPLENVFGCQSLTPAEDWTTLLQQWQDCREHGNEQKCYYRVKAPDGNWRWVLTTLVRVRQHTQTYVNAVSVDITAAKTAEQQANTQHNLEKWLIAQNKTLHEHGDQATVTQVLSALNTRFQLSRSSVFTWHGNRARLHSQHSLVGSQSTAGERKLVSAASQLKPDDLPKVLAIDSKSSGEHPSAIMALIRKTKSATLLLTPIGGEQPVGFLLCESDRKHQWHNLEQRATSTLCDTLSMVLTKENILQRLEASRRQFQMAMNATNYGLWELKIPEQMIKVSPNYYKMLGFEQPGPIEFRPISVKNIHIDDKDTVLQQGRQLREGVIQEVDYETRHHTRSGEIKWLQTRGRVIKWDDRGNPLRAMGTISDITELKKAQTDLQLAYQQAEAARLAKGEFLARMSHEIRTPMNAIIGLTYMMLQSHLNPKQAEYLQDIDKAAKSLLQIIDDILDFSKIEAGKLSIEQHNFNIRKQIERICQRYQGTAAEKNLRFDIKIDDDVPHILRSDSTRLRQVLVNLLNNAFKFTNRGSVSVGVSCEKHPGKQYWLTFRVQDTGIGLATEQIATLFDPFTQGDGSRTRQYGGTGLGLAICKLLVEMMGGDISVNSTPQQGSTFTFTVLCRPATRKPNIVEWANDESAANLSNTDFKQLNVLLVEDNKVNQKVAVGMLRQLGISTTVANNGTEALYIMKAVDGDDFDLVLMDIEMPYMSGFEATDAIHRIPRHRQLPIIAMTAHVVENDKDRYRQAGMNDCISKPIAPAALARVIEANLPGAVQRRPASPDSPPGPDLRGL